VYNVEKIKESISPSAKIIAVVESKLRGETLSNNSITDSADKSNSFAEKTIENSSKKASLFQTATISPLTSKSVMESLSTEHRTLFGRIWRAIKNFFARIRRRTFWAIFENNCLQF